VANGRISTTGITKVREYFPHAAGNYSQPASSSSRTLDRYKYENKTFRNVVLNSNNNALFKNCTFEEVLYVDCSTSTSTYYNNVRFENCTFNGVIITNTPSNLNWQANCLYFTGTATFQNKSSIPEATILAPHFNVNLGNTNPQHRRQQCPDRGDCRRNCGRARQRPDLRHDYLDGRHDQLHLRLCD
jgi:hypothetical protein